MKFSLGMRRVLAISCKVKNKAILFIKGLPNVIPLCERGHPLHTNPIATFLVGSKLLQQSASHTLTLEFWSNIENIDMASIFLVYASANTAHGLTVHLRHPVAMKIGRVFSTFFGNALKGIIVRNHLIDVGLGQNVLVGLALGFATNRSNGLHIFGFCPSKS